MAEPLHWTTGALGTGTAIAVTLTARTGRQIRGRTAPGVVQDADKQTSLAGEFGYCRSRFQATAEYFWMTEEQRNPVDGPDLDSRGFHAQAGYMQVRVQFQLTPENIVATARRLASSQH